MAQYGVDSMLQFEHFFQQALRLDAAPVGFGPKPIRSKMSQGSKERARRTSRSHHA